MKWLLIVTLFVALAGCATYKACQDVKQLFPKDKGCPSGYMSLSPSSPPYCAEESTIKEIKSICGWRF
jgi:hypothetical protein